MKKNWAKGPFIVVAIMIVLALGIEFLVSTPDISLPDAGHVPEYKNLQEGTNPGAKVTLVEFTDLLCPFCAQFHPTVNNLRDEFGEDLNYVMKHSPNPTIHPLAVFAAVAVECAQLFGKRDEYVDMVFENQNTLAQDSFIKFADDLDFDKPGFEECLEDKAKAELVQEDLFEAKKVGIRGTPTIFINGARLEGVQQEESLKTLIRSIIDSYEKG